MKTIILFIIINLGISQCIAQSQFQLAIGGTLGDAGWGITRTTDGGYFVTGLTYSFGSGGGGEDMYIIRLNAVGSVQWTKTIGTSTILDVGNKIIQTTDGGYAAFGYSENYQSWTSAFYIVKFSSTSGLQWIHSIWEGGMDYGTDMIQTTDGGYALAGFTNYGSDGIHHIFIVKLDATGALQWAKTNSEQGNDCSSIIQTTDGGYALAGGTNSFGAGGYDMLLLKLNSSGSLQWAKTIGGANDDVANQIILTSDGGFALVGQTKSFGAGDNDMYLVKLDANGSLQWTKTVGGPNDDRGYDVVQTTDGGYVLEGETLSFGNGGWDVYMVKINSSGVLQWNRTVGGTGDDRSETHMMTQAADGGFAVTGWTNSYGAGSNDVYIMKFDANGNICGGNTTTPTPSISSGGAITTVTPTITTLSVTFATPSDSISSGGTVTTICAVGIQQITNNTPIRFKLYQNYPNPFNPVTKIKFDISMDSRFRGNDNVVLKVYDILGREVTTLVNEKLQAGTYEVEWNASNFASGIYYYKLKTGDDMLVKKMIILK